MPIPSPDAALPLAGKTIFLGRPQDERNDALIAQLTQAGARVIHIPLIQIQPLLFEWIPTHTIDCLWFTSANALQGWTQHAEFKATDWQNHFIAVVGPGTEAVLRQYSLTAQFISPVSNAQQAILHFQEQFDCTQLKILWPRGDRAVTDLKTLLTEAGAQVQEQVVYHTQIRTHLSTAEQQRLQNNRIDIALFTSPSTVDAYAHLLKNTQCAALLKPPIIACFGPSTAKQAVKQLGKVDIQANAKHFDDLTQQLQAYFSPKGLF